MGKDQRVKTFKDVLRSDIKSVFLNFEEFGEEHEINGETVLIIIDENELTEREKRIRRGIDAELHKKQLLFYVAAEDFGPLPSPGRLLDLDGKKYEITEADNEDGIYSINLEAKRS
jgi:hypothetical protein